MKDEKLLKVELLFLGWGGKAPCPILGCPRVPPGFGGEGETPNPADFIAQAPHKMNHFNPIYFRYP